MLQQWIWLQNLKETIENNFVSDIKGKVFHNFRMKQKFIQ